MDKQKATRLIAEKVAAAQTLITEAQEIADEAQIIFGFNVAYGMGGTYHPKGWNHSSCYGESDGWQASSQSC